MACNRITAGDHRGSSSASDPSRHCSILTIPTGSTAHVRFNTSKTDRWETDSRRCHINWVILDSDWEAEFCRVAESHPRVRAYVKNHNLGLEVPYRYGSETRKYLPDFIVLVDDGHGHDDLLHLIVEIKGYRREDAKEKKSTMETYWVPGVNNLRTYGRWAFAEFTEVYQIEADFKAKVESEFNKMINIYVPGDLSRCQRPPSKPTRLLWRSLLRQCGDGKIQLPDFQRSWVWAEDRILSLIASISSAFPIGALMTLESKARLHDLCATTCSRRATCGQGDDAGRTAAGWSAANDLSLPSVPATGGR